MNANELAEELDKTGWTARFTNWELLDEAAAMLHQQQAEIDKVNAEWVQAAMALGKCVQENHDLKAEMEVDSLQSLREVIIQQQTEIEVLKEELKGWNLGWGEAQ